MEFLQISTFFYVKYIQKVGKLAQEKRPEANVSWECKFAFPLF